MFPRCQCCAQPKNGSAGGNFAARTSSSARAESLRRPATTTAMPDIGQSRYGGQRPRGGRHPAAWRERPLGGDMNSPRAASFTHDHQSQWLPACPKLRKARRLTCPSLECWEGRGPSQVATAHESRTVGEDCWLSRTRSRPEACSDSALQPYGPTLRLCTGSDSGQPWLTAAHHSQPSGWTPTDTRRRRTMAGSRSEVDQARYNSFQPHATTQPHAAN